MFTQKVVKSQTKATGDSTNHFPGQHSTLLAQRPSQSFGNQAKRRLLAHRAGAQTGGDYEQKGDPERMTPREAPRRLASDFSRIPVFPPDRTDQSHVRSAPTVPPLTAPIQLRLEVGSVDDPLEREADRVSPSSFSQDESKTTPFGVGSQRFKLVPGTGFSYRLPLTLMAIVS